MKEFLKNLPWRQIVSTLIGALVPIVMAQLGDDNAAAIAVGAAVGGAAGGYSPKK